MLRNDIEYLLMIKYLSILCQDIDFLFLLINIIKYYKIFKVVFCIFF